MGDSSGMNGELNDSGVVDLTGKIMVVAIIILFFVIIFIFLLHLYAKWFWNRIEENSNTTVPSRRRRRFDFAPGHQEVPVVTRLFRGLDPSVLKSIPVVEFSSKNLKEELECAVCLSEVSEGEKTRLLPKCNHGFHVDCIDMWFQSHSTCPLCRNPVSDQSSTKSTTPLENMNVLQATTIPENSAESPNFPTNVLYWGNETQVNSLGEDHHQQQGTNSPRPICSSSSSSSTNNRPDGMLVIDIPRQINEEEEETKSPFPTRLRSLKRLLSRDRRGNICSPSNIEIEQGMMRS